MSRVIAQSPGILVNVNPSTVDLEFRVSRGDLALERGESFSTRAIAGVSGSGIIVSGPNDLAAAHTHYQLLFDGEPVVLLARTRFALKLGTRADTGICASSNARTPPPTPYCWCGGLCQGGGVLCRRPSLCSSVQYRSPPHYSSSAKRWRGWGSRLGGDSEDRGRRVSRKESEGQPQEGGLSPSGRCAGLPRYRVVALGTVRTATVNPRCPCAAFVVTSSSDGGLPGA